MTVHLVTMRPKPGPPLVGTGVWFILLPGLLWAGLLSGQTSADALVVTKAMKSSTIAEFFIQKSSVELKLEIGPSDVQAFAGLLPDELFEQLAGQAQPLAERLAEFCQHDLVLKADDQLLAARLDHLEVRRRIARNEVTGKPLPVQPEDAELVFDVQLTYELPQSHATLSITPPTQDDSTLPAATIGFVVYHNGLPVNDFRYLSASETLDLDWQDPWYSRFRNRNLKRQFDAPLSVFLYVENFEVRKEIIVRPRDLQQWVDLGLDGRDTLEVSDQENLKQQVAAYLMDRAPVLIDGEKPEPILDRVHFIRRSIRKTGVIDPPEDLDLTAATLGVIFVYPTISLPEQVQLTWDLFSERIPRIPAVATDEAGGLPSAISAEDPVLIWKNFLTNPTTPAMVRIDPPRTPPRWSIPTVSAVAMMAAVALMLHGFRARRSMRLVAFASVVLILVGIICLPYARTTIASPLESVASVEQAEAEQLLGDLLHNVYRAFDRREERLIYDRLEKSISGDLLTDVYVQMRSSMELENQGGARVKINGVTLQKAQVREHLPDGGFVAECDWQASGSVGHWGHTHQQVNQYSAMITVRSVDGAWKITRLLLNGVSSSVAQP